MHCHLTSHILYYCYLLPLLIRSIFKISIICSHLVEPILLNSIKDCMWASHVVQWKRICLPIQETWVQSLGWEDPLEKEMATPSSILTWKTSWIEEPGRLQSIESQRVRHDWSDLACMMHSDIFCFIYSILLYSFLLKYSWFTISCSCRSTAQSFNFTHTHTHTYVYTHTHILFQILS